MSTLQCICLLLCALIPISDGWRRIPKVTKKRIVKINDAPNAPEPGDYSQAVVVDNMVYVSGQLGIDPATGELVEGGIEAQTNQSLRNAAAILKAAGSKLENVVRAFVMLNDVEVFGGSFNDAYSQFFTSNFPARTSFTAKDLPLDALVEIEVIAVVGEIEDTDLLWRKGVFQTTKRRIINTPNAPLPTVDLFNQAVVVGDLVYLSGQFGRVPDTGAVVPGGIGPQTTKGLENVVAILEAAGSKIENIVKVTAMLIDKDDYQGFNPAYRQFFCKSPTYCDFPARSSFVASAVPFGAAVEFAVVAVVGEVERY